MWWFAYLLLLQDSLFIIVFFFFFFFFCLCHVACGILVPRPGDQGSNQCPLCWELGVLTTRPPGKFLSLSFESLIIMCLIVGLFEFNLLGFCWDSWMFISCISSNLGHFQSLFLQIFSLSFSLPSGTSMMCILVCLMVSNRSLMFCSLSSIFFLSVPLISDMLFIFIWVFSFHSSLVLVFSS